MGKFAVGAENGLPIELHYTDQGDGQPVVLIHGWPLSGRSWESQVPALIEAGYRVITYDRRGFGQSSQPWNGYDYDTLAADLHALLEHLDVRAATLVGYSMGGGEVARYIATYGTGRVAKVVLAATALPYRYKADDNPEGDADDALIAQFEALVKRDRLAFLADFLQSWFGPGQSAAARRDYAFQIAAFASPKATVDCIASISRTDFRADLGNVTVPTLLIHGDTDAGVPWQLTSKRVHNAIAGSELVIIEGAPHGLVLTHAEQFNQALLDFLKR